MTQSSDDEVHYTGPKALHISNIRWKVALATVVVLAIIICIIIWFARPKCDSSSRNGQVVLSSDFHLYIVPSVEHFDGGRIVANISDTRINEASGIAVSRQHRHIIYTFNDSGGKNRLFAISTLDGSTVAVFTIVGARNCDWEDITLGPGPEPGRTYIYIGDVGGNAKDRCDTIYMVQEPDVMRDTELTPYNIIPYSWPENNCETLFVHPNGDLYLISKVDSGNLPKLYQVPRERVSQPSSNTTQRVQLKGGSLVTLLSIYQGPIAGDVSPNGQEILIKNYEDILQYDVVNGETVARALQHLPTRHRYHKERQGEAVAWDAAGDGFFTLGEGVNQPLWYHTRLGKK